MTPRELADKTVEDIIMRRLKAENDLCGYEGEVSMKRNQDFRISFDGYRW